MRLPHFKPASAMAGQMGSRVSCSLGVAVVRNSHRGGHDCLPYIACLLKGYETVLGKWFGGVELSGSEWKRVTLARTFLRQTPRVILDEPTSAMDSWAEAERMARFRTLVAERTTLMLTHCFTTAMYAAIIHVMVNGKIVESGTHVELVNQNGRYAIAWRQQMQRGSMEQSPTSQKGITLSLCSMLPNLALRSL